MGEKLKEKPTIELSIIDSTLRYSWKTSLLRKVLDYEVKNCTGCSLCLVCPWEAITLGPIVEVAAGRLEEAPLVNVEVEKCTFCGLCVSVCIFNSLKMSINGLKVEDEYSKIDGEHNLTREKCLPCLLCSKVCQREAIDVKIKLPKKEDLVRYETSKVEAKGKVIFYDNKCCYCGLCEILCDAIKIFWVEAKPPDFKPAVGLRIDENKCDYCGLCEKVCPSEALKVECEHSSPRKILEPKIEGEVNVDDKKCVKCGLCASVCPAKAINVKKPFKGKVSFVNLKKCDPVGCKNCFNICPVNVIYIPRIGKKIDVVEDFCIFCGACEKACPELVIKVSREEYNIKNLDINNPWEKTRIRFFEKLVGREVKPPIPPLTYPRTVKVEFEFYKPSTRVSMEKWSLPENLKVNVEKKINLLVEVLKNPTLKMSFEVGKLDKILNKVSSED
ncbi:MAG: 4Fe-4S binding protein [Candidatus Bathyarchaeota archaeon]|nr:4Fe-4S binding protein [Candidatus Bathyarchaeota archaeon]